MKRHRLLLSHILLFSLLTILLGCMRTHVAEAQNTTENCFNVVFVMDASGSINEADPGGVRFDAIKLFASLLKERGNSFGGIVFTEKIEAKEDVAPANSAEDKERVTELLGDVEARGDTDIGEALSTAVDMLQEGGDKKLPSVILLLSDGNTDLPGASKGEMEEQIRQATAKASNAGVQVYSICLNADNNADTSALTNISKGTGGDIIEVRCAEDLQQNFGKIHQFIYGSWPRAKEYTFGQSGILEHEFDIPDFDIGEFNICLSGDITSIVHEDITIFDSGSSSVEFTCIKSVTFILLRITDVTHGRWKLKIKHGKAGDNIRVAIGLVSNLNIHVEIDSIRKVTHPDDTLTVRACLCKNNGEMISLEQYKDLTAELTVYDTHNNKIVRDVIMSRKSNTDKPSNKYYFEAEEDEDGESKDREDGRFESLEDGQFNFIVCIEKEGEVKYEPILHIDEKVGPHTVDGNTTSIEKGSNEPPKCKCQLSPVPTVNFELPFFLAPFKLNPFELDLTALFTDEQDAKDLEYDVKGLGIVKEYYKGRDKRVLREKLGIGIIGVGISKLTIRAIDKYKRECEIEIVIIRVSLTLIVILLSIYVFMGLAGIYCCWTSTKASDGTITIEAIIDGRPSDDRIAATSWKGRLHLDKYNLGDVGINYKDMYIQATGRGYALLKSKKHVHCTGDGSQKKKRLLSHAPVFVSADNTDNHNYLELYFESKGAEDVEKR